MISASHMHCTWDCTASERPMKQCLYDKIIITRVPTILKNTTGLLLLTLLLVLHSHNNTDSNKLSMFSGIAWNYGDTCIKTRVVQCCLQMSQNNPGCQNNLWPLTNSRPWGQDKLFVTLRQGKKKQKKNLSRSSPNSNCNTKSCITPRATSEDRLTVLSQDTILPKTFSDN